MIIGKTGAQKPNHSFMSLPPALRALQHYNFRLYFSGQAISLIGTWMQRVAVSWLVYSLTDSPLLLGITAFAGQIPVMLLSPFAGAYTDRHSRYRILLTTQVASMIQAGLLALMVWRSFHHIPGIILLAVMLGVINAFDIPSRQSLMILLVKDRASLPNAIALNSTMVTLARLLGPAAAGFLLTSFGEDLCFFLNFLSFIPVIGSLLLMKLEPEVRKTVKEPIWTGLREGYAYLRGHTGIRGVILLMAATSFFVMPFSTLFPVYARDIFAGDERTYGWLNSISGLGAFLGAVYMASGREKNLLRVIAGACLLLSVSLLLFSFTRVFPLALLLIMAAESGMLSQIAATNTYIQTNVDEHMRGRVISYYVMAFQGMQPIGSLLVGLSAHTLDSPTTVRLEAVAGIVAVLLFFPFLKKMGREKGSRPPPQ